MSEQSEALAEAHLMHEGSTMRIMELGRRNELVEDGARHIIRENEIARQRYHSELENAVRHIQEQHHNAEETAEKFRQQRERLQQECHEYVAEKEEMNRQEMASITSRLAANAEMVMVNNENLQANAQNAVMIKDQELVHMQGQIPESTENMRQKDLTIEDLKQKLRDQIAYAGKLKTLSSMDIDSARMSLRDSELTLKNEIIEQRRLMSNCEHECINERMSADQLRDKNMILDNEASIKAVMENFKEKNAELSEDNYQLRLLRVTEILQGKWDDVASLPNSRVVGELRRELSRLQQEFRAKNSRIVERSATVDKRTTEEITKILIQRDDAILKNGTLHRVARGKQEASTRWALLRQSRLRTLKMRSTRGSGTNLLNKKAELRGTMKRLRQVEEGQESIKATDENIGNF
jgi:plasmid stabilization system protein ParE